MRTTAEMTQIRREDRVLSPLDHGWDSFFLAEQSVSDDFMTERATQAQADREDF